MEQELKLYTVSDNYVNYLNKHDNRVSSNKEENRNFERKYLGTVLNLKDIYYFAPLASPKDTDYYIDDNGNKKIRKSIVPIIRIIHKEQNDSISLLGTIKFNNMIPIIDSVIQQYNIQNEPDQAYRDLVSKQWIFIRSHKTEIYRNAKVIYNQKINNIKDIGYLQNTVDFVLLEQKAKEYNLN